MSTEKSPGEESLTIHILKGSGEVNPSVLQSEGQEPRARVGRAWHLDQKHEGRTETTRAPGLDSWTLSPA